MAQARAGDRIEVRPPALGVPARTGTVVETGPGRALRVRWDDGHESVYFPGPDCRVVGAGAATGTTTLGCHIDVRVTEDDRTCEAVATLVTRRGSFEARGLARRNPADPQVPHIGEELAIGRALHALADQLTAEAGRAIAHHETEPVHLIG